MKERPILMNDDMVCAILEGRKTQTRRPIKPQPPASIDSARPLPGGEWQWRLMGGMEPSSLRVFRCPFGQVGERLWLKETFGLEPGLDDQLAEDGLTPADVDLDAAMHVGYRADGSGAWAVKRWRPPIHMPRWASRIDLEITDVRVQRLGDINTEDLAAEGFAHHINYGPLWFDSFCEAWDAMYAKKGMGSDIDPWVWAITFKRIGEEV